MKAVVLAAREGTRLRPLTTHKPKRMVEVAGKPLLTHCFENLVGFGAEELLVVVGYRKKPIIEHYGDTFEGVPITYALRANLGNVVTRQQAGHADAAYLIKEIEVGVASRYGVCDTNDEEEIVEMLEKPGNPPSNPLMTGLSIFTLSICHARHLVQPSDRSEYEISDTSICSSTPSGRSMRSRLRGCGSTSATRRTGIVVNVDSESKVDRGCVI